MKKKKSPTSHVPTAKEIAERHKRLRLLCHEVIEEIYRFGEKNYANYTKQNTERVTHEIAESIFKIETALTLRTPPLERSEALRINMYDEGVFCSARLLALAKVYTNANWKFEVLGYDLWITRKRGCILAITKANCLRFFNLEKIAHSHTTQLINNRGTVDKR